MDYSSLPKYPPPLPSESVGTRQEREYRLTQRQVRVLMNLVWLAGIMALLLWVRAAADDNQRVRTAEHARPTRPPLEFRLVEERFGRVQWGAEREEVERLLGPPTEETAWGPEVERFELHWWNGGRNFFPADREWNRWSDPTDPGRWAAVVYVRRSERQTVYGKLKKGF